LLSEGQLLIADDLIRIYDRDSPEIDKFTLESSDGWFQMDGKVIDFLFYVFEARMSHQAYAITRNETRRQREKGDGGDGDGGENFILEGEPQEPIGNEDFSHLTPIQPIRGPDSPHQTLQLPTLPPLPHSPHSPQLPTLQIESPSPQPQNNDHTDPSVADPSIADAMLWHNRLCLHAISTLQKAGIVPKSAQVGPCKACIEGKHTKLPYRRYEHNAKRTLWCVHSDMSGMSVSLIKTNYRYFITFVDDLSRYAWIDFTARKDAKSIRDVFQGWSSGGSGRI
jgi:hypothetical protein